MDAKLVNLQEWEAFGGGGFGESYYNKTDDSVVLKLNRTSISARKAEEEFRRTQAVYDMGIPSARPYEFVTDGQRYGMIVERIRGKESFGRILADQPGRLEELAGITAACAKALHTTPCNTEIFDNAALETREIIAGSEKVPDDIKARILGYLDELEPATTCLHGDINPCNIITAGGKVYWIDLGDFGYGDPLLDFAIMAHMSQWVPDPLIRNVFHIDRKMLRQYYEAVGRQYFGPRWDSAALRERLKHVASIQSAKALCLWPNASHINLPYLRGDLREAERNLRIGDQMTKF